MSEISVLVESGYGYNTRQPFVAVSIAKGNEEFDIQMLPHYAREVALNLLEAAEAAESDGFLVEFTQEAIGVSIDDAAAVLNEFRIWRRNYKEGSAP